MANVRELTTLLRYKLDESGLRRYVREAKKGAEKVSRSGAKAARGWNKADQAVNNFNGSLRGGVKLSRSIGEQWKHVRGYIGAAAVAAAGFFAVSASKDAARFEKKLQDIGNTANLTGKELAGTRKMIFQTSKVTGQSAQEVRKGVSFLTSAGLAMNKTRAAIVTIGRAATAESANIEDLSKASFTLMDSMNIQPEKLADSIDILTSAGKQGNVELKDMAQYLPMLAGGFKALKMTGRNSVASMGAALQISRKMTGDAASAANNMANFLNKMLSPTTLKKAKKEFGLDLAKIVNDAQKAGANPMEAAIKALKKATGGDMQKITSVFQDTQARNFLLAMIQNWGDYIRIKKKALSAKGVVDTDFGRMQKTNQQRMKNLANAWGRFKIKAGKVINELAGAIAEKLNPLLDWMANHLNLVLTVITAIGATTAFVMLEKALVGVAGSVRDVIEGLRLMSEASWASIGPYAIIAAALFAAYLIIKDIYDWLTGGDSVLGSIVGKASEWGEYLDPIRKTAAKIWGQLSQIGGLVAGIIVDTANWIAQLFGVKDKFKGIGDVLKILFKGVLIFIKTSLERISATLDGIISGVKAVKGWFADDKKKPEIVWNTGKKPKIVWNTGALQTAGNPRANVSNTDNRQAVVNIHGVPMDNAAAVGRSALNGTRKGFGPYSPPTVEQGAW